MSLICRLRQRDFVIGGDATYTSGQLAGTAPPAPRPFDAHNYRRSLQELRLFAREYPDAVVTPGHDPEFFAKLEPRYE
jgi:glyoxylase-like metal-dependent hydrolase (beta-lactamase superfamily II)